MMRDAGFVIRLSFPFTGKPSSFSFVIPAKAGIQPGVRENEPPSNAPNLGTHWQSFSAEARNEQTAQTTYLSETKLDSRLRGNDGCVSTSDEKTVSH